VSGPTTLAGGRAELPGYSLEPVALGEVDLLLERQRRQDEEDGHGLLVRASVSNLVVVCRDRTSGRQALAAVERLGQRAPSRCVVLIAEPPSGREEVHTWARVVQRHPDVGPEVFWDEVVVQTTVPPQHLVAVVLPLLLPELPVFTWWTGTPPFGGEVFAELTEVSNRLIVDSAAFDDPAAGLVRLARAATALSPALSDCVWGRLMPWRQMLAAPFDGPPLRGAHHRIRSVEVEAVEPTAGLELVGWFASRLGWQLDQVRLAADPVSDTWLARWSTPGGSCETRVTTSLGAGTLTKAALEVDSDDGPASVRVEAPPGHLLATVTVPGLHRTRRRVGLPSAADPIGLTGELQLFGRDRIFEAALLAAARLAEAGGA
jgi:glucose-6-phosphate dehydrogenase assembly protein OpcA